MTSTFHLRIPEQAYLFAFPKSYLWSRAIGPILSRLTQLTDRTRRLCAEGNRLSERDLPAERKFRVDRSVNDVELNVWRCKSFLWDVILQNIFSYRRFHNIRIIICLETICIWSPGLSQIFGQLLDHSHRKIFPLTSVLQDHWTWVSPVCLEPNDLGVHLILHGGVEQRDSHGMPADAMDPFRQIVAFCWVQVTLLDRDLKCSDHAELEPCQAPRIGDRWRVKVTCRLEIPDKEVTIIWEAFEPVPPNLQPLRSWQRAVGDGEPGPSPLPVDLRLPHHSEQCVIVELQGLRRYVPTVIPSEGCEDQNEHPPSEDPKRLTFFVETFDHESLQSSYDLKRHWCCLLELFAPFSIDLVDDAFDLWGHSSRSIHCEPSAHPPQRVKERWDHRRPAARGF